MATITIKEDIKLRKNNFVNIFELYDFIEKEYILPDLKFHNYEDMSVSHKKKYNESLELKNADLLDI